MGYTADELIAGAKVRAFYPATGGRLTDAEILRLADGELVSAVFPRVLAAKGDWNLHTKTHSIASGTTRYRIPKDAHAGRLKNLRYADPDGNERDVDLIDIAQAPLTGREWSRDGFCAYVQRGDIVLAQSPTESAGSLLMDYYKRPSRLALVADCGLISSVSTVGSMTRLTCATGIPNAWTVLLQYDVIQGGGTFDSIIFDRFAAALSTVSDYLEYSPSVLATSQVEAGDYIALAGYSPIPQIPDVAHPWLEQLVAVKLLEVERDLQAMALAQGKADILRAEVIEQLTPRVDAEAPVIVPVYSPFRCE